MNLKRNQRKEKKIESTSLLLLVCREDSYLLLRDIRPLHKLLAPLHDGDTEGGLDTTIQVLGESYARRSTQDETRFLDRAGSSNSNQGLSSSTRKDNDA